MKANRGFFSLMSIMIVSMAMVVTCTEAPQYSAQIGAENILIYFNNQLYGQVMARFDGKEVKIGDYRPSEYIVVGDNPVTDFNFKSKSETVINDQMGEGIHMIVTGESETLKKEVTVSVYKNFPAVAVFDVTYTNIGPEELTITGWVNNHYQIKPNTAGQQEPPFWSFQGASYESRPDWVLPLKEGFSQENYMGMNDSDYGGGTPVVDVWRRDVGIAVGHLEMMPKLISLPVEMPTPDAASLRVEEDLNMQLAPGDSLKTMQTFIVVHQGDFFQALTRYRQMMIRSGIKFDVPAEAVYEPIWCAWGFERNFTIDQIYNALPQVKKMGYDWAVLDDGWQTAEGDWYLDRNKFPQGDSDMKKLVNKIHSFGLKAKLWWAPLAVDPGTELIKNHPEYLLLNKDGSRQEISWWDAYYLCPAYAPVQEYTRNLVETFMKKWGYDGLKIDGQHLNAAPPCYNPAHHHNRPEESFEQINEFFRVIYQTALNINPDAVVEICPCGTAYAFHTMPYMNQSVASDPESSWQVRLKGKTFKALMGPSAPYYGDHVELSDGRDDFASSVGVGAVIGTKFTWPVGAKKDSKIDLTPEKEKIWQKWLDIYKENMLPTGEYLGSLYDLGFYRPEAHAIRKDSRMYYAFYADDFSGKVELRGLNSGQYRLLDYETGQEYREINGPVAEIPVEFKHHLLLEAIPE